MTTTEHTWTGLDGQIHGHDDKQVRVERIAKEATDIEHLYKWAATYAQSAERDVDAICHTLAALPKDDENVALRVEADDVVVQVRTLRRLVAQAYGRAAENALAAEREAAGIGQPLPEDEF